jgi:hypothetical protein
MRSILAIFTRNSKVKKDLQQTNDFPESFTLAITVGHYRGGWPVPRAQLFFPAAALLTAVITLTIR